MNEGFEKGMPRFGSEMAPVGTGPVPSERVIDLIAAAKSDVAEAREKGLFVPLPQSEPGASQDRSRNKTIRNRLFILGYLEKDTGRGNLDPSLKAAIRAFQAEAGLEADGWVGEEETWPALQELVSFETPIDVSKWFTDEGPRPALRRAAALRLFVFGLLKHRPDSPDVPMDDALKTFVRIWERLFSDAPRSKARLSPDWVRRLFDMDGITRRLSQVEGRLGKEEMNLCHPFILNAAKVELWLMGYRVRPGGYDLVGKKTADSGKDGALTGTDVWMRSATVSQYNKIKKSFLFYKALHAFWLDQGKTDAAADTKSIEFLSDFQDFFKIVDQGIQSGSAMGSAVREADLESFIRDRKDQIPSIWETVKQFGNRIWDGVRRVWGWFVRMLKRAKERVITIGTNLSRLIYDFALGSFTVVSRVFDSIATVIGWIANPRLPGSDAAHILFYKDSDNDIFAVSDRQADPGRVSSCCRELQAATGKFSFGCQVIGAFVSFLREAFTTAWKGYFGLVLALVRLRRVKHRLKELIEAYRHVYAAA